jgi:hypothetical protein
MCQGCSAIGSKTFVIEIQAGFHQVSRCAIDPDVRKLFKLVIGFGDELAVLPEVADAE